MTADEQIVVYWDTSAILSALFQDRHSKDATTWARRAGVHLLSSLAWAEAHAVIRRIERERVIATVLVRAAREAIERGPWHRTNVSPEWKLVRDMSTKWTLRGPDLWHLAAAKTLQVELPELRLVSFDTSLAAAAKGEGLV